MNRKQETVELDDVVEAAINWVMRDGNTCSEHLKARPECGCAYCILELRVEQLLEQGY